MNDFENQLRRALERKEPSPGFAARVVARANQTRRPAVWAGWRAWTAAAVAASLGVVGLGIELEHRQRTREQGEAARAQLIQAMQITSSKLQKIQKKVQGAVR